MTITTRQSHTLSPTPCSQLGALFRTVPPARATGTTVTVPAAASNMCAQAVHF